MVSKARLIKIEALLTPQCPYIGDRIWAVALSESGQLQSGWVDPEEWRRWHPDDLALPQSKSEKTSLFHEPHQRELVYNVAISKCESVECPWHGFCNRKIASRGNKLTKDFDFYRDLASIVDTNY